MASVYRRFSRDTRVPDFNRPCMWKCCTEQTHLHINRKYFWMCMGEMQQRDKSYCPVNRLVYERSFDLNNGDDDTSTRSAFHIGLDPENRFQVAARIHMHSTGECLRLDAYEFRGLLNILEFEKESILAGAPLKNSTATQVKRYKVQICSSNVENTYTIVADNHIIQIDSFSLKRLCYMCDYIGRIKHSMEQKSDKCETEFFKLMSHFYYGRTVNEACIECECAEKRESYLRKIINYHCDCLDKAFVLEIALNCAMWFGLCIPYFLKTLMLNEFQRWQTFKSSPNWPRDSNKICGRTMAKSGFFYSGTMDNAICAFCGINLHDWKEGDVPIVQHFKSNPKCTYLINDSAKKCKIDEIMQALKTM